MHSRLGNVFFFHEQMEVPIRTDGNWVYPYRESSFLDQQIKKTFTFFMAF